MKISQLFVGNKGILKVIIVSFVLTSIAYVGACEYRNYDIYVRTIYDISKDDICIYPNYQQEISGYLVEGNHFVPTDNDPQLLVNFGDEVINGALVEFDKNLVRDTVIQLYYAEPGQGLQGDQVIIATIPEQTQQYYIELVPDSYGSLRFDINGEFYLKSIYLVKSEIAKTEEVVKNHRKNKAVYDWMFVVFFFFIFAVFVSVIETVKIWKRD